MNEKIRIFIKDWVRLERLVPFFVFLISAVVVVSDWIWFREIPHASEIIIGLIGILGIDAFLERVKILDRIEKKLLFSREDALIKWDRLPDIHKQTSKASEICIISPAMATLINRYPTTIEEIIHRGCKIKILLLNPFDDDALENWKRLQKDEIVNEKQIRNTITQLKGFMRGIGKSPNCEIRFSEVFIPFSMLAVDMKKNDGTSSMNVEFHGYKIRDDVRPHIVLTPQDNYFWFKFYVDQFDAAWEAGKFINLSDLD